MQLRTFKQVFDGVVVDIRSGILSGYKWRYYSNQSLSLPAGAWDLQFQETMKAVLSPGGVFYDVGANFGFHSLVGAALVGNKGRIYAFEPVSEIAQVLKEQLNLNKIRNCTWVGKAVGEINGPTTFFRHKSEAGLGTLIPNDPSKYDEVRVECVTLDSFAKRKKAPRAVKVDVEGAEDQVIAGAQNLMSSSNPPVFLVELHTPRAARRCLELFETHGYKWRSCFDVPLAELSDHNIDHIIAWRVSPLSSK